jgi:alpha-beta hydrolase superfamily lysophospholipase
VQAQPKPKKTPKSKLPYTERNVYINPKTGYVRGTQSFPKGREKALACLIIPGSGPTDRNGNNGSILMSNAYKFLSDSLASRGYAVIRYDKRGVAESADPDFREDNMTLEEYVKDASVWIKDMKKNYRYTKVVVIGHSEGSLIGMLAADSSGADGFISLAGPGRSADTLILNQLRTQSLTIYEEAEKIIRRLNEGKNVEQVSPLLQAVFRPSVQNYLRSWFKYDPRKVIRDLKIPVMIIQGTTDIQVETEEADLLHRARPDADLLIINGMNHVLKSAPEDRALNLATYFNPELPLHPELVPGIVRFLQKIENTPTETKPLK